VADQPGYVEAEGVVDENEGFFCSIRYTGPSDHALAPRRAGIAVMASGYSVPGSGRRGGAREVLYREEVLKFQIVLTGDI